MASVYPINDHSLGVPSVSFNFSQLDDIIVGSFLLFVINIDDFFEKNQRKLEEIETILAGA